MYPLVRRATATAAAFPSFLIVCQAQNKRLSFQKTNLSNGGEERREGNRPSEEASMAFWLLDISPTLGSACLAKAETSAM